MIDIKNSIQAIEAHPVLRELGIHCDKWRLPYREILKDLHSMSPDARLEALRNIVEHDFFLFCYLILDLPVNHPFLLARCYEVQDKAFDKNSMYLWARDHWKALSYDTLVLTTSGWKKHGELKVGDYVYGSRGTPVKVVARTKNFENSRQYEIEFDKKIKIIASSDHIWNVNKKSKRRISGTNKRHYRDECLMTTDEIFEYGYAVDKKLSVNIIPVEFKKNKLPVDPYTLGAWLGDGSSDCGRIHGIDDQIFDEIKKAGYEVRDTSRDITKSIINLIPELNKLGLKGNKHIPDIYKYSHIDDRKELIRGLMDTDGTIDNRGTCTFVNINKKLSEDLHEVLLSVGVKSNIRTHIGKWCDKDYVFYNVSFNASKEFIPFRLKRKADKVYLNEQKHQRFITNIRQLKDGENLTNCIQVDSEDGIYLVGKEFIPTHNSTLITFARTLWKFAKIKGHKVFLFSNSTKLIKPHFKKIKKEMEENPKLHALWPDIFWQNPLKEADWTLDEGLFLKGNSLKDPSLACYGLIDSMPTGGHPNERIVDDLVDLKNIGTQFMMNKVLESYRNSDNLSSGDSTTETIIGTRYLDGDLYQTILEDGTHEVSIRPAEVDENGEGLYDGIPVYLSAETLAQKKIKQKHVYHAQHLLKPLAFGTAMFEVGDLQFYNSLPDDLRYYIVADPAINSQYTTYKDKDMSAMWLLGAGKSNKLYVVDMIHEDMGIKDRWEQLKMWHSRYSIDETGYEEYGTQKDREFFDLKMEEERFYFKITPIKGDLTKKSERISQLCVFFNEKKIYFPKNLPYLSKTRGVIDLITDFIDNEYKRYPNLRHEDRLDALSLLVKLKINYPVGEEVPQETQDYRKRYMLNPLNDDMDIHECYYGGL